MAFGRLVFDERKLSVSENQRAATTGDRTKAMPTNRHDELPPHCPSASLATLRARHNLLKQLRLFFDQRDFLEVTTPILSQDTVIDEHLDPFQVVCYSDPQQPTVGPVRYLQTSPEFHMKRLLCAGANAIYQIGPAFRAAEQGQLHNPEFSMLEWYRVEDDMWGGIELLEQLVLYVMECEQVTRVSYAAAFESRLDLNPHQAPTNQLRAVAGDGLDTDASRDDLVHYLWNARIACQLGKRHPVIVYDFPASQAALAQIRPGSTPVAERFELYWRGVELANGYHELRDADELRLRNARHNKQRRQAGRMALPEGSLLLAAMENGLPGCAGVALGVDRLLMLLMGFDKLGKALAFDFSRA